MPWWISEIERGKDSAQIGRILRVLSFLGVRLEVGEAPWTDTRRRELTKSPLSDILTAHSTGARGIYICSAATPPVSWD